MTWLDCSHCGGVAIESEDGMYSDGAGEACDTCGHPGTVSIDDAGPEDPEAWWRNRPRGCAASDPPPWSQETRDACGWRGPR